MCLVRDRHVLEWRDGVGGEVVVFGVDVVHGGYSLDVCCMWILTGSGLGIEGGVAIGGGLEHVPQLQHLDVCCT